VQTADPFSFTDAFKTHMKTSKPKLEANWRQKSLERLEKTEWPLSDGSSSIVERGHRLRKTPVGDFSAVDLRFLLLQNMGFPYTLELALPLLREDLLVEAGYYPGDLLEAMLSVGQDARRQLPDYFKALNEMILPRIDELQEVCPRLALNDII
jgi:hypothetical protein